MPNNDIQLLEAEAAQLRMEYIQRLEVTLEECKSTIEKLEVGMRPWLAMRDKLEHDLRSVYMLGPAKVNRRIESGKRRSQGEKGNACVAVYERISAEPGRRFSAADLATAANGFKVRILVAEWNRMAKDRVKSNKAIRKIELEGEFKQRVYFVAK